MITRVMEHLRQGRLVALPTEAVYEVVGCALNRETLAALNRYLGEGERLALVLGNALEIYDWLPFLGGTAVRLARRFWPGPLTVVSGAGFHQGQIAHLPATVRQRLGKDQVLGLRFPDHQAARLVASLLGQPLAAAATPWTTPQEAALGLSQEALLLDDGPTFFRKPATVVRVHGKDWKIDREGAVPLGDIEEAAPCHIVFVCTGNTCRSPLAQALCVKLLTERLGCTASELAQHGFRVQSAGLAAMMGGEATPEAVEIAREMGADLTGHRSRPLTMELLAQADHLFTMTRNHLLMLEGIRGAPTPRLLSLQGEDVADPIGSNLDVYRACARQIHQYLEKLLPELQES